ncbi:MAG: serine hydrolase [Pseudomonadota bacterium]
MPRRQYPLGHLLLTALLSVAGCSATPLADSEPEPTYPDPPDDWYASALERMEPLGHIVGAQPTPLPTRAANDPRFEPVIEAAAAAASYGLIVWHNGQIVVEQYFAPYSQSLRPESASMAKTVLGLAVAAAITDGVFKGADARIGDYLPAWRNDPRGDVTLRQLLTMSAGFEPLSREGGMNSAAVKFWADGPSARDTLLNLTLRDTPGEVFYYQDTLPPLLLLALEAATGQPYERYLAARLWQRIGASDAYVWRNEPDGFPRAQSALLATARDWLRVGLLIKDNGSFLGERVIAAGVMDEVAAPSATNPNYGWLLWRGATYQARRYYNDFNEGFSTFASEPYRLDDWLFLDGYGGQRVYVSRQADLVIVRLGALRGAWDDALLPNLASAALGY